MANLKRIKIESFDYFDIVVNIPVASYLRSKGEMDNKRKKKKEEKLPSPNVNTADIRSI